MVKTIKQFTIIHLAAAMALSFGCGMPELIDDLRDELKDNAPYSMNGKILNGTRTYWSTGFLPDGSFTLTFTDTTFSLVNIGGSTETGTYTYSNTFNDERIVLSGPIIRSHGTPLRSTTSCRFPG